MAQNLKSFSVKKADGSNQNLADLKNRLYLVVNVASKCGLTPHYKGLEELYRKHKEQGFTVLGFPCNQFGAQEPGTDQEIQGFCQLNYDVSFPVFSKIDVNGEGAHPLYKWLTSQNKGEEGAAPIKWNFAKFLIDENGEVIQRYGPQTEPKDIEKDIQARL